MRGISLKVTAALALSVCGLVRAAATVDRIVAIVGGEPVMQSDIDRQRSASAQAAGANTLLKLIEQRLLAQAAKKEGIRDTITEAQIDEQIEWRTKESGLTTEQFYAGLKELGFSRQSYRQLVADQLAQQRLLRRKIGPLIAVAPEEVANYYREHRDEFRRPERRRIRMISVFFDNFEFDDPARRREEARKQIDQVVAKLKDRQDMAYLAKQYSQDSYAGNGGDWGWKSDSGGLGGVLSAVALKLDVGQISDVIATDKGLHVMRVEACEPAHVQSFEQVQEQIRADLRAKQHEALRKDFVRRLWDATQVELF